jgi:hypothetical protein
MASHVLVAHLAEGIKAAGPLASLHVVAEIVHVLGALLVAAHLLRAVGAVGPMVALTVLALSF